MDTKTYNKSLSARVRRRNKAGFKGEGNHSFVKKTQYGDYNYPIDNHKNYSINLTRNAAISIGKKYYYKHVGSKSLNKFMKIIHDFCTCRKDIFEIIAEKKKKKSA